MWQAVGVFVAAIVAVVGFLQLVIARQKVRLDLFDKRFAVYEGLREALSYQLQRTTIEKDGFIKFLSARSRAQFLFGPEVIAFLDASRKDLMHNHVAANTPRPLTAAAQKKSEDEAVARIDRLGNFYSDLDLLVLPYMQHAQKRRIFWRFEI